MKLACLLTSLPSDRGERFSETTRCWERFLSRTFFSQGQLSTHSFVVIIAKYNAQRTLSVECCKHLRFCLISYCTFHDYKLTIAKVITVIDYTFADTDTSTLGYLSLMFAELM